MKIVQNGGREIATARLAAVLKKMEAEVRAIEKDDRYDPEHPATVVVNAPLALVQLEMETRRATIMRYAAMLRDEP